MNRKLLVVSLVFVFLGIDSLAMAGVGSRWRARRRRARTATVYRSTGKQYYRTPSPSRSTSQSQKPWYINSEPAFNSYRTRILYSHLGYPDAFSN